MNKILIIFLFFSCLGCQPKTSKLDKLIAQEQYELNKDANANIKHMMFYCSKKIWERGSQPQELKALTFLHKEYHLYQKLTTVKSQDSLIHFYTQYQNLLEKEKSDFYNAIGSRPSESWNVFLPHIEQQHKIYEKLKAKFNQQHLLIFQNLLTTNQEDLISVFRFIIGTSCGFYFTKADLHLDKTTLRHHDTLHARILFPFLDFPMKPNIKINGNIIKDLTHYEQIIDSNSTTLEIEVNYQKELYKDTTFYITRKIEIE